MGALGRAAAQTAALLAAAFLFVVGLHLLAEAVLAVLT